MNPSFKFKYDNAGTNPVSGQQMYTGTMVVEMPDGTLSMYKAGQHNSREKLENDLNRMMASVSSSLRGNSMSAKQNYGSETVNVSPSEALLNAVRSGDVLTAPSTYEKQRVNSDGTITRQMVNQQGIRQNNPYTTYAANMLDPNYNAELDAIINPITGLPVYNNLYGGLGSLLYKDYINP